MTGGADDYAVCGGGEVCGEIEQVSTFKLRRGIFWVKHSKHFKKKHRDCKAHSALYLEPCHKRKSSSSCLCVSSFVSFVPLWLNFLGLRA